MVLIKTGFQFPLNPNPPNISKFFKLNTPKNLIKTTVAFIWKKVRFMSKFLQQQNPPPWSWILQNTNSQKKTIPPYRTKTNFHNQVPISKNLIKTKTSWNFHQIIKFNCLKHNSRENEENSKEIKLQENWILHSPCIINNDWSLVFKNLYNNVQIKQKRLKTQNENSL